MSKISIIAEIIPLMKYCCYYGHQCTNSSESFVDALKSASSRWDLGARENGFLDNRVPTRPPAAAGRLTLNT